MEISKIEIGIPHGSVDNQDVFELLKHYSDLNINDLEHKFFSFVETTGAKHRFWRETPSEPYSVLMNTSRRLFEKFDPNLIDIVISCGASKYFAEPAHASIFCSKFRLTPSLAFDVSDGCMGWITAIEVLQGFVEPDKIKYALIISHEFPMGEKIGAIYPSAFKIKDLSQFDFKLPALTVGEATTLTIVKLCPAKKTSQRLEFPEGAEFCTMPFCNYAEFSGETEYIENSDEFHAHYNEMSKIGARPSLSMLNKLITEDQINLVPHSYTHAFDKLEKFLKFDATIINFFSEYGNTATSSIPLNLAISSLRNELDW